MQQEKLYKLSEIAKLFNISKSTVRDAIVKKNLKAIQFGKIFRVSESNLQEFVKKFNYGTLTPPPPDQPVNFEIQELAISEVKE